MNVDNSILKIVEEQYILNAYHMEYYSKSDVALSNYYLGAMYSLVRLYSLLARKSYSLSNNLLNNAFVLHKDYYFGSSHYE